MEIGPETRPRLRRGCRFSEMAGQENVLLIPEGLLKLAGPGRKILDLCDGTRTFAEIIVELQTTFTEASIEQVEKDTSSYLERLRERGAVEF